jgi:uncharacterized phiE125 gp8 family phage protein
MAFATTIIEPTFEVATAADARAWCRIDSSVEDATLTKLIAQARRQAEHETDRALLRQTLELVLDAFPADGIELDRTMKNLGAQPTIVAVTYVDPDGATQTMPSGDYYVDDRQTPCWLLPAVDTDWPSTREQANAVIIQYTAGFDEAAIPEDLWTYVMASVAARYRQRELDSDKPLKVTEMGSRLLDRLRTVGV